MVSTHPDISAQVQIHYGSPGVIGLPLDQQQRLLLLDNKLLPLLPYPITVIRRIQFEIRHPSPTAQVYLATTAVPDYSGSDPSQVTSAITTWLSQRSNSPPPPDRPFIAAYVDLFPAGQTQVILFASWEIPNDHAPPFVNADHTPPSPPPHPITTPPIEPDLDPAHTLLLQTLLTHLSNHLIPLRPQSPPDDWLWLRDNKKYLSQPYSTNKVLFGAVHSALIPFFSLNGSTRRDGRYLKSLFPPQQGASTTLANNNNITKPTLPSSDYTLGTLTDAELHTVLARSPIPRTIGTLRSIVNVGIYHHHHHQNNENDNGNDKSNGSSTQQQQQPQPQQQQQRRNPPECVAWGFLSKDGSISSVHVEPGHRGHGLAGMLTAELLRKMRGAFDPSLSSPSPASASASSILLPTSSQDKTTIARHEEDNHSSKWWGHVDVEENNTASRRVMEKLGAQVWFGVQWVEIDVRLVLESLRTSAATMRDQGQ